MSQDRILFPAHSLLLETLHFPKKETHTHTHTHERHVLLLKSEFQNTYTPTNNESKSKSAKQNSFTIPNLPVQSDLVPTSFVFVRSSQDSGQVTQRAQKCQEIALSLWIKTRNSGPVGRVIPLVFFSSRGWQRWTKQQPREGSGMKPTTCSQKNNAASCHPALGLFT